MIMANHAPTPENPVFAPMPFIRLVNGRVCRFANCSEPPRQSVIAFHAFSSPFERGLRPISVPWNLYLSLIVKA